MTGYLELLEGVLRTGLETVGPAFKDAQVSYVVSRQTRAGGFPGREGEADPYYTDFALRLLALLAPYAPALSPAAHYVACADQPRDLIEAFNLLNCRRLLRQCGFELDLDLAPTLAVLAAAALPGGGFARAGAHTPAAYFTFLGALCYEMLDLPLPHGAAAAAGIAALQELSGGYREQRGEGTEQTNATAAAAAFLLLVEHLSEQGARLIVSFLSKLQAADGGFLAHPAAPVSDLLSTFTALSTLAGLDGFDRIDLPAVGQFLRRTALPAGGFKAAPADTAADIEYTYYGVGCMALLHAAAG